MAKKTYDLVGWQNESTGNTPVSPGNLNHMDKAIKYLYDEGATSKDIFICRDGQTIKDAPEEAKIVFENNSFKTKASEVINSMEGNQTDLAPSVDAVKKYVDNKNAYSTEEVVIGTYFGKPFYRKVLTGMLPTGKGENSFNLSSECLIKTKYGRIKSTLGPIFELDTYYIPSNAYSISSWITADEHGLKVDCGANYSTGSKYEITVEYTKTTD